MRCARIGRWSGAYLPPRNPRPTSTAGHASRVLSLCRAHPQAQGRALHVAPPRLVRKQSRSSQDASLDPRTELTTPPPSSTPKQPKRTTKDPRKTSSKLAALHARLSLPARFSLRTLSRCLTHSTASPTVNNSSLAILGQELIAQHTCEWLICNYPRIPMPVLYAAQYSYSGDKVLTQIAREWGVEAADAPGEEVDAGYLQFGRLQVGNAMASGQLKLNKDVTETAEDEGRRAFVPRRTLSSKIVMDDEFGDMRSGVVLKRKALSLEADVTAEIAAKGADEEQQQQKGVSLETASASFIRSVFGAMYLYAGAQNMQAFHRAHILSRHLELHKLFHFKNPIADLARLCDREGLERPVARLISETGRRSRTPVFVVGIYSGNDKLGEDAGGSLHEGRLRAAAHALRSWYLYSPPREQVRLPSQQVEMERKGIKWIPQHIDNGEIVT